MIPNVDKTKYMVISFHKQIIDTPHIKIEGIEKELGKEIYASRHSCYLKSLGMKILPTSVLKFLTDWPTLKSCAGMGLTVYTSLRSIGMH